LEEEEKENQRIGINLTALLGVSSQEQTEDDDKQGYTGDREEQNIKW